MLLFWSFPRWGRMLTTIKNIHQSTDNLIKMSETANQSLAYLTKVTGVSLGSPGAANGRVDILEALACQDGVCADELSMGASLIPRPNLTRVFTVPISVGWKVFGIVVKQQSESHGDVN